MFSKEKAPKTNYLLPEDNFFTGLGSILNIAGSSLEYDCYKTDNDADLKALSSDWLNVGNDMKVSKEKFKNRYKRIIDKIKSH